MRQSHRSYEVTATQINPRQILAQIVQHKEQEIAQMRQQLTLGDLQRQLKAAPPVRDFLHALQNSPNYPSLIAEVKKASPSKGIIRQDFDPVEIATGYVRGGAACLSVLTDSKFFQGSFENLQNIRPTVAVPLLCKEFVIHPYQIYKARVAGADAVLLIAAILSDQKLQEFLYLIHSLGMNALVEVHTLAECDRVLKLADLRLMGINNRNLETFNVDLATTSQLMQERSQPLTSLGLTVVSESGLYSSADLAFVASAGVRSVLVGESLIKQPDVEQAVRSLLDNKTS
nr:indole-3-glycerol phosphate synthase TrpC [Synechocystis sp. PCC 7509]